MKLDAKKFEASSGTNTMIFGLMGIGIAVFLVGLLTGHAERAWAAFLIYHTLAMGLSIGALFFLVVHYLAGAGWNVAIRRVTESFASYFFIAAIFNVILLFGASRIYPWTNLSFMESEHVLRGKIGYFSSFFFSARVLFFTVVVGIFARMLLGNSIRQDDETGATFFSRQKTVSALFLVLFAPLMTMFAVDVIKSLDPKWFSTMFGVYVFIGFVQFCSAATIVAVYNLKKLGYLEIVTADHFHDMGKYLIGFTIFWAYIGVSQYLLIWYANLPEETTFYLMRQKPGWVYFTILLPTVRFVLPFLLLLPRMAKRNSCRLVKVAYLVMFGAWLDVYWLVMPKFSADHFGFSFFYDVGLALGFAGFFLFAVRSFLSRHPTVPVGDPFLHETMHHHVY